MEREDLVYIEDAIKMINLASQEMKDAFMNNKLYLYYNIDIIINYSKKMKEIIDNYEISLDDENEEKFHEYHDRQFEGLDIPLNDIYREY